MRDVSQKEKSKRDDPLSSALFSLGFHEALYRAQAQVHPVDFLVAYLDNVYVCTIKANAKIAFNDTAVKEGRNIIWKRVTSERSRRIMDIKRKPARQK